jgi:hypothetical protein
MSRKVFIDLSMDDIRHAPECEAKDLRSARFEDALTGYYHGMYDTGM